MVDWVVKRCNPSYGALLCTQLLMADVNPDPEAFLFFARLISIDGIYALNFQLTD